jgi:uncharacterized membrane protein
MAWIASVGLLDAGYLTYEKYSHRIVPCTEGFALIDCGKVLDSPYSLLFGVPVSVWGMFFYTTVILMAVFGHRIPWDGLMHRLPLNLRRKAHGIEDPTSAALLVMGTAGLGMSVYFVSVQLMVIRAICPYCMLSAIISITLFFLALRLRSRIMAPDADGTVS